MVSLGAYAGLRFGEASALRVDHLRLLERRIEIHQGSSEVNGKLYVGPLKTKESRRVVTIPAFLADELGEHLAEGPVRPGLPLAIRRTSAANELQSSLLAPAVKRAGISPAPTLHELRHTAVALAITEGAHPKAFEARLGHASSTTTLNIYGHLFPSLDVELAERLGDVRADALAARLRHARDADAIQIETAKR